MQGGAGPSEAGLGPQALCAEGQLTSISSMCMGSASRRVMASGDSAVTRALSGGAGKSYQPFRFFPSSHTHVLRQKHGLWSQAKLGSHQAQASHWPFDLGYVA